MWKISDIGREFWNRYNTLYRWFLKKEEERNFKSKNFYLAFLLLKDLSH
jgi:hypothetical protein